VTRGAGRPGRLAHPLAGALDRLLARERGDDRGPGAVQPNESDAAQAEVIGDPVVASTAAGVSRPEAAAPARRMLVIAALGEDGGDAALRTVARWALAIGRRPAALDLVRGGRASNGGGTGTAGGVPSEGRAGATAVLPWAGLPGGPERLRVEPPEVVAELIERLRQHEIASDLLLVLMPPGARLLLMRAALLSGGIVLPLDDSADALEEACRLSREVLENFVDLDLWPFADDPVALQRYLEAMQEFPGARPCPLEIEMGRGRAIIDRLHGAPAEGFLAALLAPDDAPPPPHLLQTGFLRL